MRYTFDSREVRPGMGFVALKGEKTDGHAFIPNALAAGAAAIVDGLDELQRLARERRRRLKAKVIGISGSAGKTTTKELLKAFLAQVGRTYATEGNFNNHIGLPLTIMNCPDDAEFLALEMGTNHPGEIAALCDIANPDAGLITNVGTAHLEFFKTQDGIAAEKGTLFARLGPQGFAVTGADNVRLAKLRELAGSTPFAAVAPEPWLAAAMAETLPGAHNAMNAAIAYAMASHFGATPATAVAALKTFALPGARWRRSTVGGVRFVDDSYNANPDSMIAALDAFVAVPCAGRRIAVLGDMFELGDDSLELHRRVFDHAAELPIAATVAVGAVSSLCRATYTCADTDAAKALLKTLLRPGDTVLLKGSHGMHLGELVGDTGLGPVTPTV